MCPVTIQRTLVGAFAITALLCILGVVGVSTAIQTGTITPPEQDVQFGSFRIVAFTTNDPTYPAYWPRLPEMLYLPPKRFYVVWILVQTGGRGQDSRDTYHETGIRLFMLQLRR